MAVAEQLGPVDIQAAFVKGGELVCIDGRAQAWTYKGGKQKDANGDPIPAPESVEAAFKLGLDRFIVIDGKGVAWSYNAADSSWIEGHSIEDKADPEAKDDDVAWSKGVVIEAGPIHADELRKAKALVASEESDEKEGKKSKKKEAA